MNDKYDLKSKSNFDLVMRMNQIMVEQQNLDLEHNAIVLELWDRIPKLVNDVNIQPKTKKRVPPKLPPGTPGVK